MNDLMWKLKQLFRKVLPFAVIGGLLYGGWTLHRQGAFRHGPKHAILAILHKIPYFGSRFQHYGGGGYGPSPSYSYSGRGNRHRSYRRHRHHRRHR